MGIEITKELIFAVCAMLASLGVVVTEPEDMVQVTKDFISYVYTQYGYFEQAKLGVYRQVLDNVEEFAGAVFGDRVIVKAETRVVMKDFLLDNSWRTPAESGVIDPDTGVQIEKGSAVIKERDYTPIYRDYTLPMSDASYKIPAFNVCNDLVSYINFLEYHYDTVLQNKLENYIKADEKLALIKKIKENMEHGKVLFTTFHYENYHNIYNICVVNMDVKCMVYDSDGHSSIWADLHDGAGIRSTCLQSVKPISGKPYDATLYNYCEGNDNKMVGLMTGLYQPGVVTRMDTARKWIENDYNFTGIYGDPTMDDMIRDVYKYAVQKYSFFDYNKVYDDLVVTTYVPIFSTIEDAQAFIAGDMTVVDDTYIPVEGEVKADYFEEMIDVPLIDDTMVIGDLDTLLSDLGTVSTKQDLEVVINSVGLSTTEEVTPTIAPSVPITYPPVITGNWKQPILTSNSSYGTVVTNTFVDGKEGWKAFDGFAAGATTSWEGDKGQTGIKLTWILPETLSLNKIYVYNKYTGTGNLTRTVSVYADADCKKKLGTVVLPESAFGGAVIDVTGEGWETDTITWVCEDGYFPSSTAYVGIGEIAIDADLVVPDVPDIPISGDLTETNGILGRIKTAIDNFADGVKTWFNTVIGALSNVWDTLKALPGQIATSISGFLSQIIDKLVDIWGSIKAIPAQIIEGLQALFAVDGAAIKAEAEALQTFLDEKLGLLFTPVDIIIKLGDIFLNDPPPPAIHFPELQIMGHTFAGPYEYTFEEYQDSQIKIALDAIKFFTSVILVMGVINYLRKKGNEVLNN